MVKGPHITAGSSLNALAMNGSKQPTNLAIIIVTNNVPETKPATKIRAHKFGLENPAFENRIDLFALAKSVHGNIGMTNDRILAQSGSFIISGLDNLYINNHMLSTRSDNYSRMIIKNKKVIVHELQLLNITDATMLPDLTHKADYIKDQINNSDLPKKILETVIPE